MSVFCERVSSLLKPRQRKQQRFPPRASLTEADAGAHPQQEAVSTHPQTHRRTSALREPMTSIQMRQTIRRTASTAPPCNIGTCLSRRALRNSYSGRMARSGAALTQTNRIPREGARLNRCRPEQGLFSVQGCQRPDVTHLLR